MDEKRANEEEKRSFLDNILLLDYISTKEQNLNECLNEGFLRA